MGNRPQMRAKTMGKTQMITARVPPNVRPEFSRAGCGGGGGREGCSTERGAHFGPNG